MVAPKLDNLTASTSTEDAASFPCSNFSSTDVAYHAAILTADLTKPLIVLLAYDEVLVVSCSCQLMTVSEAKISARRIDHGIPRTNERLHVDFTTSQQETTLSAFSHALKM